MVIRLKTLKVQCFRAKTISAEPNWFRADTLWNNAVSANQCCYFSYSLDQCGKALNHAKFLKKALGRIIWKSGMNLQTNIWNIFWSFSIEYTFVATFKNLAFSSWSLSWRTFLLICHVAFLILIHLVLLPTAWAKWKIATRSAQYSF